MLDIKFLRENPEVVKQNIRNKFQDQKLELVDKVIELDKENRDIKQEVEALRAKRNKISKQIGALMGQGKREEAEEVKKQVAVDGSRIEALSAREKEVEEELLKNMSPADLSAEVKETLDDLRANGHKLAIGSSSKNARFILGQLGLGEYFDAISDGNNISKSKPDPEVFVKAAEYVDEQADKCLVVEDAKAGLQAAIAGGMDCAAIGDAVASGLGTYNLSAFADLLKVTAK